MILFVTACGVIGPSSEDVENFVVDIMPVIAEWRGEALAPYGTEAFNRTLAEPGQARMMTVFSRLGDLASFEPPRTVGWSSSTGQGTQISVEVAARFERGPALLKMTLRREDGQLRLHGLNIESPVFSMPSARPSAPQQI
ncbi:hypothetical protein [Iodidimonas sp. SYSU 1G8]|uniref:hypothetical protein n=1 Tax=Iodidimonas sp. SYSU 1G8 TaxID=3133967 RepID=UPI0031FECA87